MITSDEGIEFIKRREGVKYTPYQDVVGIWTVGVGHVLAGEIVKNSYTDEDVNSYLKKDLGVSEGAINRHVKVPLEQHQFDALSSFVFNCGAGNFSGSTLLKELNDGNYADVPAQLLRWNHAGGKVIAGLTKRRELEGALFRDGVYG